MPVRAILDVRGKIYQRDSKGTVSLWRSLGAQPISNHRKAIPYFVAGSDAAATA